MFESTCSEFSEGLCPVKQGNRWAYIEKNGKEAIVLPPEPETRLARPFKEGVASVWTIRGWHYIRRDGAPAFDGLFAEAFDFDGGLAMVTLKTGETAYIDHRGRIVWRPSWPCTPWSFAF